MLKSKHCEICSLQAFNIQEGILCSLTNKKPEFNSTCPDIKLDEKLRDKIFEIESEIEDTKYTRKLALGNLGLYASIGLAVIFLSYYIGTTLMESGIFSTVTITIFFIGLSIVGIGVGTFNYYLRKRNVILPKKIDLDDLIALYDIAYEFSSKITMDMMGVKETKNKLRIGEDFFEQTKRY